MFFFGFPSVTEFIDQRSSLNLMHQIACCAALVSPIGSLMLLLKCLTCLYRPMFAIVDFCELI